MGKQKCILHKAAIILICITLSLHGTPAAYASGLEANTMTALLNDAPYSMALTSFYQFGGYVPTFSYMDSNGFPLLSITLYIPFGAQTGSIYSSGIDNTYGAGVAYSDFTSAASYSTLAAAPQGDNYFGFASGQTAWTLQIDSVSEDGTVISGQFAAVFESTVFGTGEPATVYDGMFSLDLKQLPAAPSSSMEGANPFLDSSLDSLLGPIEIPDFSMPSASTENTPCRICNGTGYKRICSLCKGLGYGTGSDILYKGAYVCASCLGEGKIICVICDGDGWVAP